MLSPEQIYELANREELQRSDGSTLFIWVTGLSGAGKTFVLERLEKELRKRGETAIFSDGAQLLKEIENDAEGRYHVRHDGRFLVTSTVIDDRIHEELRRKAEAFEGNFFLIELARGKDVQGQRDLSFQRLSRSITNNILAQSVFIYVDCPYEERVKRNQWRNGQTSDGNYRRINPVALERFFQEDDFDEWRLTIHRPIIVLDNS
jgi:thymidylate kinase